MATITDLTNTTWYIPAGWSTEADVGQFNVYGSMTIALSSETVIDRNFINLHLGYYIERDANHTGYNYIPAENSMAIVIDTSASTWISNASGYSVTFTGGTDATDEKLIAWLEANGELVSGGEEDELYLIEESTLTDIADAIRTKKGITGYLDPANYRDLILSIGGSGGEQPTIYEIIKNDAGGLTYVITSTNYVVQGMTYVIGG